MNAVVAHDVVSRLRWLGSRRLRSAQITWRIGASAARGMRRGVQVWWIWVRVREVDGALKDAPDIIRAHIYRGDQRRRRVWLTIGASACAALLLLLLVIFAGLIIGALIVGATSFPCAVLGGRRAGERLTGARRKPKASQDAVNEALRAAKVIKPEESAHFVEPVSKSPNAWETVIDLPPGTEADKLIRATVPFASALAVDEMQVLLERVRGAGGHAGRARIWVANQNPYSSPAGVWPLADADRWDFWKPFPFGMDARGTTVDLGLLWTHFLIGSIPRVGKTFTARLAACAAALDPAVKVLVFDGKGGIDWRPFSAVATTYRRGVRAEVVAYLRDTLLKLVEDMNDRYDRIAECDPTDVPESKLTPSLARTMPVTTLFIDEVHRYLEALGDRSDGKKGTIGGEILDLLIELAKVGPAVGIILVLATQKPDTDTLPSSLRDVMGTRFALRTMTWQTSDTILGAGAYRAGADASKLLPSQKGVGILLGADDETIASGEPTIVRAFYLDTPAVKQICERGRLLRLEAGNLAGDARGPDPLLTSMLTAFGDQDRLPTRTVLVSLGKLGTDATDADVRAAGASLAELLRPYGVVPRNARFKDGTASSYFRADIIRAVDGSQR